MCLTLSGAHGRDINDWHAPQFHGSNCGPPVVSSEEDDPEDGSADNFQSWL